MKAYFLSCTYIKIFIFLKTVHVLILAMGRSAARVKSRHMGGRKAAPTGSPAEPRPVFVLKADSSYSLRR